jgi:hypothetical protein
LNKKSQRKSPVYAPVENKSTAGSSGPRPRAKQITDSAAKKLMLVKKAPEPTPFGAGLGDNIVEGAIGAILKGGEHRVALLEQLRKAVKSDDKKLVFEIAERYCGLTA